jgi:hypothetical protein
MASEGPLLDIKGFFAAPEHAEDRGRSVEASEIADWQDARRQAEIRKRLEEHRGEIAEVYREMTGKVLGDDQWRAYMDNPGNIDKSIRQSDSLKLFKATAEWERRQQGKS